MNEKFLTVYAVLDNDTQKILSNILNEINSKGLIGSQTDIPFHISLGSYSTKFELELVNKIREICKKITSFEINLNQINYFAERVLFIEPEINDNLLGLRNIFDNDVNKEFQWHPHTTLFIDDKGGQFLLAKQIAEKMFKKPIKAKVVGIHMGEFFPARIIIKENLQI